MPEGNLHEYAVQAEANLEKLATGLAEAGADPGTVQAVSKMADVTRQLVTALGKGQERTGDDEPADADDSPEQQPSSMDSATAELQQRVASRAQARRGE